MLHITNQVQYSYYVYMFYAKQQAVKGKEEEKEKKRHTVKNKIKT